MRSKRRKRDEEDVPLLEHDFNATNKDHDDDDITNKVGEMTFVAEQENPFEPTRPTFIIFISLVDVMVLAYSIYLNGGKKNQKKIIRV